MVVVERRPTGRSSCTREHVAAGAAGGALWGGLIELIFLAPLLGLAVGAASGGAAGALTDVGVDDKFMKDLGDEAAGGRRRDRVLVRQSTPDKVLPRVTQYGGEVVQSSLDNRPRRSSRRRSRAAARPPDPRDAGCCTDAGGHGLDPRGHLRDGLRGLLSGGAPGPRGRRRRLLDRRPPRDRRRVPPLRGGDRLRDGGRAAAGAGPLSRRRPRVARPRLARLPPSRGPVDLRDVRNWWAYVPGASWRHARGTGLGHLGRARHPVTHVAYEDARPTPPGRARRCPPRPSGSAPRAAGSRAPPTPGATSSRPAARMMANTWQGDFPWENLLTDGYAGTSPVGGFPPNGYGLFDMTGNIWEWTVDCYHARRPTRRAAAAAAPARRRAAARDQGRLAPVRAQLLPALPAGGPPVRDGRHVDIASRFPLRRRG